MSVLQFLQSGTGRVTRIIVGLVLVVLGLWLGGLWLTLSVVGLVPIAAGAFGFCLLAPFFHRPIRGGGHLA